MSNVDRSTGLLRATYYMINFTFILGELICTVAIHVNQAILSRIRRTYCATIKVVLAFI